MLSCSYISPQNIPTSEIVLPFVFMYLVGLVHCQVISTSFAQSLRKVAPTSSKKRQVKLTIYEHFKLSNRSFVVSIITGAQPMHWHADIYWPVWRCCQYIYCIGKILPKNIRNMCLWKLLCYCSSQSVWKPKLLLRLWLINANALSCSLRCTAFRLHQVVRNVQNAV